MESLDADEAAKLASCLEYILDIVGESMPEVQIKETIIKCDFDKELALGTLLNSPVGGPRKEATPRSKMKPRPTRSSPPPDEATMRKFDKERFLERLLL